VLAVVVVVESGTMALPMLLLTASPAALMTTDSMGAMLRVAEVAASQENASIAVNKDTRRLIAQTSELSASSQELADSARNKATE
jgi:hypothetical protein